MKKGVSEVVWIAIAVFLVLVLLAFIFIFSDKFQMFAKEHITTIGNAGEAFGK